MRRTRESKGGKGFCCESDGDGGRLRLGVHLALPVVDLVEAREGEVRLDGGAASFLGGHAHSVGEESDFCAALDDEGGVVFVIRFEGPGGDALFLNGEELGEGDVGGMRVGRILRLPDFGSEVAYLGRFGYLLEPALFGELQLVIELVFEFEIGGAPVGEERDLSPRCVASDHEEEEQEDEQEKEERREENQEWQQQRQRLSFSHP